MLQEYNFFFKIRNASFFTAQTPILPNTLYFFFINLVVIKNLLKIEYFLVHYFINIQNCATVFSLNKYLNFVPCTKKIIIINWEAVWNWYTASFAPKPLKKITQSSRFLILKRSLRSFLEQFHLNVNPLAGVIINNQTIKWKVGSTNTLFEMYFTKSPLSL